MEDLQFKVSVKSDTTGLKNVEQAIGGVSEKASSAAKNTGKLAGEVKELGKAGHEAQKAFDGLTSGSLTGMVSGLKAVGAILAGVSATFLTVFIPAVVGAGIAIMGFRKYADDMAKSVQDSFDKIRDSSLAHNKAMEEMRDASVASLKRMQKEVDATIAKYQELEKEAAAAAAHAGAVTAAKRNLEDAQMDSDRQKELSAAKSPEERDAINRKYDAKEASTKSARVTGDAQAEQTRAKEAQDRAHMEEKEAGGARQASASKVVNAQNAVKYAKEALQYQLDITKSGVPNDEARRQASHDLQVAQGALSEAQSNHEAVLKSTQPSFDRARTADQRVRTLNETTPLTIAAEATRSGTRARQSNQELKPMLAAASQAAASANASSDWTGLGKAQAEFKRLTAIVVANDKEMAATAKKTADVLSNNRESRN